MSSKRDKFKEYSNSLIEMIINEYIHDKLHRTVLKMWLLDHVIYDDIAEKIDRDVSTVKRIISRNEWTVYKHLK